ncbi:MAG: hypothetical protein R3F02_19620 [Thiolinea sp.]
MAGKITPIQMLCRNPFNSNWASFEQHFSVEQQFDDVGSRFADLIGKEGKNRETERHFD